MAAYQSFSYVNPPSQQVQCMFTDLPSAGVYDGNHRNEYTLIVKFDNFRLDNNEIYCNITLNVNKSGKNSTTSGGRISWDIPSSYQDGHFTAVTFMGGIDVLHNESTICGVPIPVKLGNVGDEGTRVTFLGTASSWYTRYGNRIDQTDTWEIQVLIPSFVQLQAPTIATYNKNISLSAQGYYDYSFTVNNSLGMSYNLKQDNTTIINTTTDTSRAGSFRWRLFPDSVGNSYSFTLNFTYPTHVNQYEYYYFTDQNGGFHSDEAGAIKTDTITLPFEISDSPSIFSFSNSTLVSSYSYQNVDIDIYSVENTKFKLVYNFTYNDTTDTTTKAFRIKLYNGGNENIVFIDTMISAAGGFPQSKSGTLYSEIFEQSMVVSPVVEVTPYTSTSGNQVFSSRKFTKTFPNITIYEYQHPDISFFDVFPSTATGDSDLTSTHASYLAQFKFSSCGGWNRVNAQRFDIYEEENPSTIVQTYNNPGLVSGTQKYIAAITYNTSKNYIVKFYITDRFGRTTSKTANLKYSGGVIMDFNKTGYGMAIGKYSESDILEVNLPTVFYNDVEYISGQRLTTDVARDLGCSDPYNVGATNIQAMLDYLVNRVLNG